MLSHAGLRARGTASSAARASSSGAKDGGVQRQTRAELHGRSPRSENDCGIALILALVISGLLAALGLSLLVMSDVERRMSSNAASSAEARAAAHAAVARGLVDLRLAGNWTPFLNGSQSSAFAGAGTQVALPFGGTLDLAVVTADLQAQSPGGFGANTPVWRLFAWGPLSQLGPPGAIESLQYLLVWIADDIADGDDDPAADSNGILTLRGEGRGPGGARRAVEATVVRAPSGVVRVISWREVS